MEINQWVLVVVLRLLLLLHQPNESRSDDNYSSGIGQMTTYRSTLEKSIQNAIGIVGFLTRPFISNDESIGKTNAIGNVLNKFQDQIHAIVPGTRWCGDGNIAVNDSDVGIFRLTDACCRQHDKCDFNIEGGQSYGNLMNNGIFTRSSCECDRTFYDCLKNVNGPLAYDVGYTYFTILGPQCINYNYPIVSCLKRGGKRLIMKKCIAYEYDISQPMALQWNDNPDY